MKTTIYSKEGFETYKKEIEEIIVSEGDVLDTINPDICIYLGGDGTFLSSVHEYFDKLDHIIFLGVKCGKLGFFYEFKKEEFLKAYRNLKENKLKIISYPLLKGVINDKDTIYGVNEIRVENPFSTLKAKIKINEELLEEFFGNGINVCSTLGSSAYNRSLGGALIDRDINLLQIKEIAPLNSSVYHNINSPLVVNQDKEIELYIDNERSILGYDHYIYSSEKINKICISYSSTKSVKVAFSKNYSYIKQLRKGFIE
ncbi:MAG: hypothetical protein ACI31G_00905 [Bacilli bacterium]